MPSADFARVAHARPAVGGVHEHALAGLRVLEDDAAHVGQFEFARVHDGHRDEVVAARGDAQLLAVVRCVEIREHEHDGAAACDPVEKFQRAGEVGAATFWLEEKDLADDAQRMQAALPRRDEQLDVIGKQDAADLVVVANRAERKHARDLRGEFALAEMHAAEFARRAHIHDEHHRQLALLGEFLDERIAHARRDVPVNRAHVVTRLILAHFLEVHSAPLECRAILTRESRLHEPAGLELNVTDFFEDVARAVHHLSFVILSRNAPSAAISKPPTMKRE